MPKFTVWLLKFKFVSSIVFPLFSMNILMFVILLGVPIPAFPESIIKFLLVDSVLKSFIGSKTYMYGI